MGTMASLITSLVSVYSTVYSGVDQRKHHISASLAFVRGIHRGPVNSPHKWPVTRQLFPFDDFIMNIVRGTVPPDGLAPLCASPMMSIFRAPYMLSTGTSSINSSLPGQNGRHFTDDIFSACSSMKSFVFWLEFHWSLFLRFQLTINPCWLR